uniref:Uncharacterized protein n=1 Tax=Cacopsylla melanoneura TaxID=428564 RepID=A0A8D8ZQ73_9HEMI
MTTGCSIGFQTSRHIHITDCTIPGTRGPRGLQKVDVKDTFFKVNLIDDKTLGRNVLNSVVKSDIMTISTYDMGCTGMSTLLVNLSIIVTSTHTDTHISPVT